MTESGSDALVTALQELAILLHDFSDSRAARIEGILESPRQDLARRVLRLFTEGMGGFQDGPLYLQDTAERAVDRSATKKLETLQTKVFELARADLT